MDVIFNVLIFASVAFVIALGYATYRFTLSFLLAKKSNRAESKRFMVYAIYCLGIFVIAILLFFWVRSTPWLLEFIT